MSIQKFVRRFLPDTPLAHFKWLQCNGRAICGLIDLLLEQSDLVSGFTVGLENPHAGSVVRAIKAARLACNPSYTEVMAKAALLTLNPRDCDDISFELSLFHVDKRPYEFWVDLLEQVYQLNFKEQNRLRIERRLNALRANLSKRVEYNDRNEVFAVRPLNMLGVKSIRLVFNDAMPPHELNPSLLAVRHVHGQNLIGESLLFDKFSVSNRGTVIINDRFLSPTHEGVFNNEIYQYKVEGARLNPPSHIHPPDASRCLSIPCFYKGTPNHYHQIVDLLPSILLASDISGPSSPVAAELSPQVMQKLEDLCDYFQRPLPPVYRLTDHVQAEGAEESRHHCVMVKAYHGYLRMLREYSHQSPLHVVGTGDYKIYVSRRQSLARSVENEADLELLLESLGFTVVCLEELSFSQQINLFSRATFIVSPHGAGLANLIFSNNSCRCLEIGFSDYPLRLYKLMAEAIGIHNYTLLLEDISHGRRYTLEQIINEVEQILAEQ